MSPVYHKSGYLCRGLTVKSAFCTILVGIKCTVVWADGYLKHWFEFKSSRTWMHSITLIWYTGDIPSLNMLADTIWNSLCYIVYGIKLLLNEEKPTFHLTQEFNQKDRETNTILITRRSKSMADPYQSHSYLMAASATCVLPACLPV